MMGIHVDYFGKCTLSIFSRYVPAKEVRYKFGFSCSDLRDTFSE